MKADDILKKHEDANEMHFHQVDRKWIIEAMEEYAIGCRELIAEGQAKEHPILFSGPMVRAILDGTKTQTRRVVKKLFYGWMETASNPKCWQSIKTQCPYGQIGDILWVRETWQYVDFAGEDNGYVYRATDPDWETMEGWRWKPSIFMPKQACRIKLRIEDLRVERLQSIPIMDCYKEGACPPTSSTPIRDWQVLWEKVNGQQSWDDNPFVWVISFSRCGRD